MEHDNGSRNGAGDISFLGLLNMHLRHRWLLVMLPLSLCIVVVAFSIMRPRNYSSVATFVPQGPTSGRLGGLGGVAAQLGVMLPNDQQGENPAFYVELLKSQALLEPAVRQPYRLSGDIVDRTFFDIFEIKAGSAAVAEDAAVRKLRGRVNVHHEIETGIVTLDVRTHWPELSQQIADNLVSLVNNFNLERRRSQATAERAFVGQRVNEAKGELRDAEKRLEDFLRHNRQFTNSPQLVFQHEQLQREVSMRQSVYVALAQAYDQARIEEVRNLPVITVVQPATLAVRPNPRGTVKRGLIALVAGAIVAWLIALSLELARRGRRDEADDAVEFDRLRRAALHDLRVPLVRLRHLMPGRTSNTPVNKP